MSPIRSPRSLLILAALVACQGSKKGKEVTEKKAPAKDAGAAATTSGDDPLAACRAAGDRFVNEPDQGPAFLAACAGLFSSPACRSALKKAAASPGPEAGMAAINACREAYCPDYELAELCENKAPPTVRVAKAQFPRLAAEVLQKEHGEALGTLDSAAYLMIKPLLPAQRRVYIRARAAGAGAVSLALGEDGWTECKTDRTVEIGKGADLRALDGPLLGPLSEVGGGVDPALVEVLIDPEPEPRVREVATAAGRFLTGRGMEIVTCIRDRANCPDVKSCP